MKAFSIGPSREIGVIKTYIKDSILDGVISNDRQEALELMYKKGQELGLELVEKLEN